ncbi:hypothetical protein BB560_000218 [Smittium megazygosporum]|uniref:Fumarylacetoacetase-like C-terminal domain-containing protein n=1 Tax=Smittium megazygosporum TaxID=133381 RepID=A0A2T9ZL12_9FUNG|nr:hypothetical protein BB560_000218 [Smittium megazygosporum]
MASSKGNRVDIEAESRSTQTLPTIEASTKNNPLQRVIKRFGYDEESLYQKCIKRYGKGSFRSAKDVCSTCKCNHKGGLTCTKRDCYRKIVYNNCVIEHGTEEFKLPNDSCNTCTCFQSGEIGCTEIICDPVDLYGSCTTKYGKGSFKSPYDSCNTCKCNQRGELSCINKRCKGGNGYEKCIRKYGKGNFKSPNENDHCNTCKCISSGELRCTDNNCRKEENYRECIKQYGKGDFKNPRGDCNTCKCLSNGERACTKKDCPIISQYEECVKRYGKGEIENPDGICGICKCSKEGTFNCVGGDCGDSREYYLNVVTPAPLLNFAQQKFYTVYIYTDSHEKSGDLPILSSSHIRKKIVAIGRNYIEHALELNNKLPTEPMFFLKPTSSYVVSPGKIYLPKNHIVHHEIELGVVIGKTCKAIKQQNAYDYVSGYALGIDLTARDIQDAAKAKGYPWTVAKGYDYFTPIGQFVPKSQIVDPHNLQLWMKVNNQFRQNDSTGLMTFKIPQLIEYVSSIMTLEEGDLILTGTPKGVGPIEPGDKINAGLESDSKLITSLEFEVSKESY